VEIKGSSLMPLTPQTYSVGNEYSLKPNDLDYDGDPRGLIYMYEPPLPRATYVMGIDPTVGRTGWTRESRNEDDYKIDNGCISIWRAQPDDVDVQVLEYAAPVDAEEIGVTANVLGRLYAGNSDTGQALCIPEAYPGPGLLTLREMTQRGYVNFFIWKYLDSYNTQNTGKLGFYSNRESVKYLWLRSSRHMHKGNVIPRSEHLVEEMRNCTINNNQWGEAISGHHDDRVRAMMLALWAIHDWSMQVDTKPMVVSVGENKLASWQASDVTFEQMMDAWEERFNEIGEAA
jgi:hypothetical protein